MSKSRDLLVRLRYFQDGSGRAGVRTAAFVFLMVITIGVWGWSAGIKAVFGQITSKSPLARVIDRERPNGASGATGTQGSQPGLSGLVDSSSPDLAVIAQSCTVNCTATVPATGVIDAAVIFQMMVDATGCNATPTFDWNFGDGTGRSTLQNPSYTYKTAGTYQWSVTTSVAGGSTSISTIAGGFGEGNRARQATLREVTVMARDPQGRGLYIADSIGDVVYVRFINTGTNSVTVAGVTIAAGAIRAIAGGGASLSDNAAALSSDMVILTGMATSTNGDLLYTLNPIDGVLRAINVSAAPVAVLGTPLPVGQIRTVASGMGQGSNAIAVHPSDGSIVVADATTGANRVLRIDSTGAVTTFAGVGGASLSTDPFNPGPALSVKLLLPRALKFEPTGNLLISDTGHGRIIRVDSSGTASLYYQFGVGTNSPNPYPSGLALFAGNVFTANGNQQTVTRLSQTTSVVVAGSPGLACDYSTTTCGDGAAGALSGLYLLNPTADTPLASIEADSAGLFIADQGTVKKGRVRYLNLSGTAVTVAGTTIAPGAIDTIAGNGLEYPYDGGLATSSTFSTPTGVAVDAAGNLWITDTLTSLLRYVNRGATDVTIFPGTASARVVPAGAIITVNRTRTGGQADGPVISSGFADPQGIFAASQGIYVVDSKAGPAVPPGSASARRTSVVRFINTSSSAVTFYPGSGSPVIVAPGNIAKIIGGGEGVKGDGGAALSAVLVGASDVVVTSNGTIYVTDVGQKSVRKVLPTTGIISSLSIPSAQYTGLGLDSTGRLYIANYDGNLVLRETAAGSGSFATLASSLTRARDVAVDANGTAYVTVSPAARAAGNHQIVQVTAAGTATVIAGGTPGFSGDGGPSSSAQIRISPSELIVGSGATNQLPETVSIVSGQNGEVIFTDSNNNRVRRLTQSAVLCQKSGTIVIAGVNPAPQLATISPTTALQNSGAFTLTVNGSNFVAGAEVRWNGSGRSTTYVSPTQLTASITAADLATAGSVSVTVNNPTPGGGLSNVVAFTITAPNPLPQLTSLSPASAVQGGAAFTLTINGTGFVSGAVVRWDGQNRTTTYVSSTQLTAQILAADIVGVGTAAVTVSNPTPGGGISSSLSFSITTTGNPAPAISAISPTSVGAGSASFTLTVTGTGFISTSKVNLNGTERTTTYVSPTQLTATISAADIATAAILQVTVSTPTPGGGTSTALPLTVIAGGPVLTLLNPDRVIAGAADFTLTINGTGFVSGAVARINGSNRTTAFVSATQITAAIPASDIAAAGSLAVTVVNPSSAPSNSLSLPIYNRVTSVSAASYASGDQSPNSILAAFAANLAKGVEITSAVPLPTTLLGTRVSVRDSAGVSRDQSLFFVAPQQVNFHLHPDTALGAATVTVYIDGTIVALGEIQVGRISPAIFTQNATGDGVPAAYGLRVRGSDVTVVSLLAYDAGQAKWVPTPIDLGPDGDVIYLVLFGSGFRSNGGLGNISVRIGSATVTPVYAGEAPGFIGLDQMNIGPLPRSLAGAGVINLVITIDGKVANQSKPIQLQFK